MDRILDHIPADLLEALLASSPVATAIFRDNRLIWKNHSATHLFGGFDEGIVTSEELAEKLIPNPLMRQTVLERARIQSVADNETNTPVAVELQRQDGELVQCEMSLIRMSDITLLFINLPGSFQYTNEIISETHKMAALGRLAQGMAHEINNPLAAISQNLQLILQRLMMNTKRNRDAAVKSGTTLAAIERYINAQALSDKFDAALSNSIRAGRIVHQMMVFAPNDRNHQYLPQDISELIDHAVMLAKKDYFQQTALEFQQIELQISAENDLPQVVCQAWKITQAFFAIIKNATEAIHNKFDGAPGGEIAISARQSAQAIEVSFKDNGTGIESTQLDKIFEPYFTTKPGNLGTGLGLASCYYVIHQEHFGSIDVQSTPGKGTIFTVSLPPLHTKMMTTVSDETNPVSDPSRAESH